MVKIVYLHGLLWGIQLWCETYSQKKTLCKFFNFSPLLRSIDNKSTIFDYLFYKYLFVHISHAKNRHHEWFRCHWWIVLTKVHWHLTFDPDFNCFGELMALICQALPVNRKRIICCLSCDLMLFAMDSRWGKCDFQAGSGDLWPLTIVTIVCVLPILLLVVVVFTLYYSQLASKVCICAENTLLHM